jgi:DNA-binding MarR family transcriptional regulator
VSYNLKKLVELGYIHHERSDADRRAVCIRLAEKGQAIRCLVVSLFDCQLTSLHPVGNLAPEDFQAMNRSLLQLERFWLDQVRYRL